MLLLTRLSFAQLPSYTMGNAIYNDCRAKFYDDGGPNTDYASVLGGTSYTLQIVTNNPVITMTFNPSGAQTQITIGDNITFYKQFPLIPANIIAGPYTNVPNTGTISNVVSTTGSLIVVFTENGNTSGKGWDAGWFSTTVPPIPPTVSLATLPSCSANQLTLNVSQGVVCDSLKPNYFVLTGPMFPGVTSVSPVPSACSNGTTSVIQLNLTQPINQNCNYSINATLFRFDKCDSVYKYSNLVTTFSIANCPIQANIVSSNNTVCAAQCSATISAVSTASVCLNLSYSWNNGLQPTAGPHTICPGVTTVYNCTITELSTLMQTVISKTIYVNNPQITALANPTVCASVGNIQLTATPSGGYWYGQGISPGNASTGIFNTGYSGPGVMWVKYVVGSCVDSVKITVIAIDAGSPNAACIGAPSFSLTGSSPAGGVWYGDPNVSPPGIFTPTAVGTYTVLYAVGICTSQPKTIYVTTNITVVQSLVTICKSVWYQLLIPSISPFGGVFSGSGIVDQTYGVFVPSAVAAGQHVINYSLNGCATTFTVNVLDIDVSPQVSTVCPSQAPFVPSATATPIGGSWSCLPINGSIQNSSTGFYDPSFSSSNSHNDTLVYTALNGCSDTLIMKAIKTNIVPDSLFFCDSSDSIRLSNNFSNLDYLPSGGIYTGPGVAFQSGNYYFKPGLAGTGVHTIFYDINTCKDSVKIVVYPSMMGSYSPTVCSSLPAFGILPPMLPGSAWSGAGIVTPSLGIYNPASVLPGVGTVTYSNKAGCTSTVNIEVYPFQAATISNLNSSYCFVNTNITFTTAPLNGTLTAINSLTNGVFNPSVLGAGNYTLTYAYGLGACYTSTTLVVKVYPELITSFTVTADTICLGESSKLIIKASGGLTTVTQYTYTWSNGLLPLTSQNVVPNATTVYTVTTSDGCSDQAVTVMTVVVSPSYYPSFITTPIKCYGETGGATITINPTGNYSYLWNTTPVQTNNILNGISGKNYSLKIKNLATGCTRDTTLKLPSYNVIKALFTPNPNLNCIPFYNNTVAFIDQSNGAINGSWSFNGAVVPYVKGQTVSHLFETPGTYNITLSVTNEGDCESHYGLSICILESTELFVPDIFSPNNDAANDVFYVRGNGIATMKLLVFDRWGGIVFESTDNSIGWDGTHKGKACEAGIYAYYLEALMFDDKKIIKKGEITLTR